MAWIKAQEYFDPDLLEHSLLGIASTLVEHDSGIHYHGMGQLLFSEKGCMEVTVDNSFCILVPGFMLWIPPHMSHHVKINGLVTYRSIFLGKNYLPYLPKKFQILSISPLLKEILEYIATSKFDTKWDEGAPANIVQVFLDQIEIAPSKFMSLPLPQDHRLKYIFQMKIPPPLSYLSLHVHASEKTITRIFHRETGLSYQQWRQQWRFIKAVELFHQGHKQSFVSNFLDFSSSSSFSSFFKKFTGMTAREYIKPYRKINKNICL